MTSYANDSLGNRMKAYEQPTTGRKAFKGQPIVVRLDGKGFHKFTKGLKRPYDSRLSELMKDTMNYLVDRFNFKVGYTQSDELSFVWFADSTAKTELEFGGRMQKIESLLAAACSTYFMSQLPFYLPEKVGELPIFDCRAFVVPNLLEAYHSILWRQQDCTKNAISMAAQSMFSHKTLQGKTGPEMQEMMFASFCVNFNDYPAFFRRGTFARRVTLSIPMESDAELMAKLKKIGRLPEPGQMMTRSTIENSFAWLQRLDDPVSFLFKTGPETYRTATGTLEVGDVLDSSADA
jgi:tRNA(His) guanylyltransferase